MASKCRIGFLFSALVVAVTAKFEFNLDTLQDLPDDYQKLVSTKARSLNFEFLNPDHGVLVKVKAHFEEGLLFYVDRSHIFKITRSGTPSATIVLEFNNEPGISVKSFWGINRVRYSFTAMRTEVQYKTLKDPLYIKLQLQFYSEEQKSAIVVTINVFKPSKDKAIMDQATQNGVLVVNSPIFMQPFFGETEEGVANTYIVDTAWMIEVLKKAKFQQKNDQREAYLAGPVVIPRKAFNTLLRLDPDFDIYDSQESIY